MGGSLAVFKTMYNRLCKASVSKANITSGSIEHQHSSCLFRLGRDQGMGRGGGGMGLRTNMGAQCCICQQQLKTVDSIPRLMELPSAADPGKKSHVWLWKVNE